VSSWALGKAPGPARQARGGRESPPAAGRRRGGGGTHYERITDAVRGSAFGPGLFLRQDHGVDDVDHAVRRHDVGLHHLGIVDHDTVGGIDLQLGALDRTGLDHLARDVAGHHLAGQHMVGEDRNQLRLVLRLEKHLDGARGQLGEGVIGGGEDGERALALQGLDQAGGLHRGDQGVEAAGGDGGIHDIHLRGFVGTGLGRDAREQQGDGDGGGGKARERTNHLISLHYWFRHYLDTH
jgi:hypothetical protein